MGFLSQPVNLPSQKGLPFYVLIIKINAGVRKMDIIDFFYQNGSFTSFSEIFNYFLVKFN